MNNFYTKFIFQFRRANNFQQDRRTAFKILGAFTTATFITVGVSQWRRRNNPTVEYAINQLNQTHKVKEYIGTDIKMNWGLIYGKISKNYVDLDIPVSGSKKKAQLNILARKKVFSDQKMRKKQLFDPDLKKVLTEDELKERLKEFDISNLKNLKQVNFDSLKELFSNKSQQNKNNTGDILDSLKEQQDIKSIVLKPDRQNEIVLVGDGALYHQIRSKNFSTRKTKFKEKRELSPILIQMNFKQNWKTQALFGLDFAIMGLAFLQFMKQDSLKVYKTFSANMKNIIIREHNFDKNISIFSDKNNLINKIDWYQSSMRQNKQFQLVNVPVIVSPNDQKQLSCIGQRFKIDNNFKQFTYLK